MPQFESSVPRAFEQLCACRIAHSCISMYFNHIKIVAVTICHLQSFSSSVFGSKTKSVCLLTDLTYFFFPFLFKTTFEDVFPAEATSVEEYLQQVFKSVFVAICYDEAHMSTSLLCSQIEVDTYLISLEFWHTRTSNLFMNEDLEYIV